MIGGAIMFGASLATEDHPAWPGWPVGALIAAGTFAVIADFAAGAINPDACHALAIDEHDRPDHAAYDGILEVDPSVVIHRHVPVQPIADKGTVGGVVRKTDGNTRAA